MKNPLQKEIESTIAQILSSSDEELLKMIDEADCGVFGSSNLPVFAPVTKATTLSSKRESVESEASFIYTGVVVTVPCPTPDFFKKDEELALAA